MLYKKDSIISKFSRYLTEVFYGGITRLLDLFIPAKDYHWIFGSDYGYSYRENSKYLFEYMVAHHPEYTCTFITNSQDVLDYIKGKGLPCALNDSLRGVMSIAKADAVFTSQNPDDIKYAFKKKNRSYYYMTHGLAYKRCRCALPEYLRKKKKKTNRFVHLFRRLFCVDYNMKDVSFVPSTSEFLAPYTAACCGNGVSVKILGMPKNDRAYDSKAMESEAWVEGLEGKTIVTYMPTHRLYGKGEVTPTPFVHNEEAQQWMRDHNVVFVMKQHPNMIPKLSNPINTDVIKDVTKLKLDPFVVMYHTDVLISDFSSAFLEYLWFQRPILLYIYDNYADVEGALYDITDDFPQSFCYNEQELFEHIKKSVLRPEECKPSKAVVEKFYKSLEPNACEQYFNAVNEDKYYKCDIF